MEASTNPRQFVSPGDDSGHRLLIWQPDGVLCRMAARGNTAAYETLYSRHRQSVYAFVFHLLGGRDCAADAEDIAQDAFAKAFAAIRTKRDGSFRHWIMTIARNRAIDHIRASGPHAVPIHDESVELDPAAAVDCASAEAEDRAEFAALIEAMSGLPDRQREALVLRELGGMTHAEIADSLGTTEPAAKQLIKRGRANVGEAAGRGGLRPRKLRRELQLATPLLPMATTAGLGLAGATGGAFGGSAMAGKAAATVLCVAAIGGTTAAVEHSLAPVGSGTMFGPARASLATEPATGPGAPDAPVAPQAREPGSAGESNEQGERRERARSRAAKDLDGSVASPPLNPAESGSAIATDPKTDGSASAPAAGFGQAGEAAERDPAGGTGGAAAP